VDPWLRVVGVSGLRLVDASVMPTTMAGNGQAAPEAGYEGFVDLAVEAPDEIWQRFRFHEPGPQHSHK
jgi:hypothetical protein